MTIKNFGKQVKTIWNDLRPLTKNMLVKAMETNKPANRQKLTYDAHADWELSSLLNALDKEVKDAKSCKNSKELSDINHFAETCAKVLEAQTESAEVFIQLATRALDRNDFHTIDKLAEALYERFSVGEIAEVIRQTHIAQIRAIAYETLAVMPTLVIQPLLDDPLYFEIAFNVVEQQAVEFESEEAKRVLEKLEKSFQLDEF